MRDSEKINKMWDVIDEIEDTFYKRTLDYLLNKGFKEYDGFVNFKNKEDKLYVSDPYAFLLRSNMEDCKFAINKKEGFESTAYGLPVVDEINGSDSSDFAKKTNEFKTKIYSGQKAIKALVLTFDLDDIILDAEAKGVYDAVERQTSKVIDDYKK